MKKFVTLLLAAMMVMSIAAPALAADATALDFAISPNVYKSVNGILEVQSGGWTIKPGQTVYIEITPNGDSVPTKLANSYRVFADWTVGKHLVDSTKIEYKRANTDIVTGYTFSGDAAALLVHNQTLFSTPGDYLEDSYATLEELEQAVAAADQGNSGDQDAALADFDPVMGKKIAYIWTVAVAVKSSFSVRSEDLNGTIRIGKNKNDADNNNQYDFERVVKFGVMAGYDGDVDSTNAPVVDFKNATDEVELYFGETATFIFNASNQDNKLFMGWNEKPVAAIINNNMAANVDFLNFEATPAFNRIGELRIYDEDARYLYEVKADGSLKKLAATYDESEECLVFKTRTLSAYAYSDVELKSAVAELPIDSAPSEAPPINAPTAPTVTKPNPGTGAAA